MRGNPIRVWAGFAEAEESFEKFHIHTASPSDRGKKAISK
jgi:hypothetical protein